MTHLCPSCQSDPSASVVSAPPRATPGCRARLRELVARERADLRCMRVHALTMDAYAVQHPDIATEESIRETGVHLISLYAQVVLGVSYREAKAIRRDALAMIDFRWLPPPDTPAPLSVQLPLGAESPYAHVERTRAWARSVWRAWHPHHEQVLSWTRRILGRGRVAEPPAQKLEGWLAGARNAVHPSSRESGRPE